MSNTNFLAALQAKRTVPEIAAEVQTFATPISATKPTLIVERVLNRNRIDLFFSNKPDQKILDSLNNHGWHYRGKDKAWYHQDSEENVLYLCKMFNVGAELHEYKKTSTGKIEPDTELIYSEPVQVTANSEITDTPQFTEFKRKVNLLVDHLKIDMADMMLLAIDALFAKHESEIN